MAHLETFSFVPEFYFCWQLSDLTMSTHQRFFAWGAIAGLVTVYRRTWCVTKEKNDLESQEPGGRALGPPRQPPPHPVDPKALRKDSSGASSPLQPETDTMGTP